MSSPSLLSSPSLRSPSPSPLSSPSMSRKRLFQGPSDSRIRDTQRTIRDMQRGTRDTQRTIRDMQRGTRDTQTTFAT